MTENERKLTKITQHFGGEGKILFKYTSDKGRPCVQIVLYDDERFPPFIQATGETEEEAIDRLELSLHRLSLAVQALEQKR